MFCLKKIKYPISQKKSITFERLGITLQIIFSPSGKLVQLEYALAAVSAGAPSVGIMGKDSLTNSQ